MVEFREPMRGYGGKYTFIFITSYLKFSIPFHYAFHILVTLSVIEITNIFLLLLVNVSK